MTDVIFGVLENRKQITRVTICHVHVISVGVVLWPHAYPDSKVHGANMGPIWGRQDPGGPHVGPMNFAIWDIYHCLFTKCSIPTQLVIFGLTEQYLHFYRQVFVVVKFLKDLGQSIIHLVMRVCDNPHFAYSVAGFLILCMFIPKVSSLAAMLGLILLTRLNLDCFY